MVQVFREVWRVLRADGTLWLNIGDSYNANTGSGFNGQKRQDYANRHTVMDRPPWLKPKDLVGIPWMLAFALRADGWYLRSDIIWSKKNPMPESVTDRPTKAHEYVFLLSKSPSYYFDQEAVREGFADERMGNPGGGGQYAKNCPHPNGVPHQSGLQKGIWNENGQRLGRNIRTVWTIATQPFPEAHFATFPEKLVEPCLKAGTSERGCCPKCGAPWVRMVESNYTKPRGNSVIGAKKGLDASNQWSGYPVLNKETKTIGWKPSCQCEAERPVPCVVMDPFAGASTVGVVAQKFNRRFVGLELKMDYCRMGKKRIYSETPAMF